VQEVGKGAANYDAPSTKRTRSMTFRLDTQVIDELQSEADQREISLNVLVNQVLKRYNEWDRYENKIGMMPVPKMMLTTHRRVNSNCEKEWNQGGRPLQGRNNPEGSKNRIFSDEGFGVVYETPLRVMGGTVCTARIHEGIGDKHES
jgi:hypothetical protein